MPDNDPLINSPYQRKDPQPSPRFRRDAALLGGGAVLLGLGIAAGVMFTRPNTEPVDFPPPGAGVTATESVGMDPTLSAPASEQVQNRIDEAPARTATRSQERRGTSASAGDREYESRTVARAVCDHCGVIESVTPVPVQGKSTGVGVVAGGVLGGVVGNQVGKGSGNTAATVLGAIGGGIAGNEIEKSRRTNTVYRVKVRMDDGTTKTFTRDTELSPGTKVEVNDGAMRVVGNDS